MKLDILAFGAHPDDVELGCGATLAKEISKGKKVGIIDLTRGELGTRGTAATRDIEAVIAKKYLGVTTRTNLKFADGFFLNDKKHQLKVIRLIRLHQPNIVLCNAVHDRHIDHAKGAKLVSDACFLSGLHKIKTRHNSKPQIAWRPKFIYHYIQWQDIEPNIVVDVSNFMVTKMKAVMAYQTQFYNPKSNEPETPISTKNFTESIEYRAKNLGRLIGVDYAEGFTVERYPVVDSLFDLM